MLKSSLAKGTTKLSVMSSNKNEYKRMRRTLTGENKRGNMDDIKINETLRDYMADQARDKQKITLIHDPSDLRKPHSTQLEYLGKVNDLTHQTINGYSSFNTIALLDNERKIHLVQHEMYSNRQPNFLPRATINKLINHKEINEPERVKKLYESGDYVNQVEMTFEQVRAASHAVKQHNPTLEVEHIFDREFDNQAYFEFIDHELGDIFITRLKLSRVMSGLDSNRPPALKVVNHPFENQTSFDLKRISLHHKIYQDVKLNLYWEQIGRYYVVKIELIDRKGKSIFKQPMLLITNRVIDSAHLARSLYLSYLKRACIESVFKFIKQTLGWEEFRLKDFKGLKNLVAISFFVAAYLYEIGDKAADDQYFVILAEIGGGGGKITRHYIWEGIKSLLNWYRVDTVFKKYKPDKQTMNSLDAISGRDF